MLDGTFSAQDVAQASLDFEAWAVMWTGNEWDDQAQADYLSAVRMALIADDRKQFTKLLKTRRSFKFHTQEHSLYRTMAEEFQHSPTFQDHRLLSTDFCQLFDQYRNP